MPPLIKGPLYSTRRPPGSVLVRSRVVDPLGGEVPLGVVWPEPGGRLQLLAECMTIQGSLDCGGGWVTVRDHARRLFCTWALPRGEGETRLIGMLPLPADWVPEVRWEPDEMPPSRSGRSDQCWRLALWLIPDETPPR